jgi:hypothetical protein
VEVVAISAADGDGLEKLKERLQRWLFVETASAGREQQLETADLLAGD